METGTRGSVLAVDRDKRELAQLVESLRSAGYDAVGTDSFETARKLLHERWYDVLVTEIKLAEYNGLHLVFHGRFLNSVGATIVLTATPDMVSETEARRLGAYYIVKPVEADSLTAFVGTVLQGVQQERPAQVDAVRASR
jgi:two-component system response regulator HydG